jgi:protein SCO1/2
VLRQYGAGLLKKSGGDFGRWEFASGSPEQIKAAAEFFGLRYWAEGGQIIHSLRTAIISPDGKLYKLYRDNQWKPEDLIADLKAAIAQRSM